MVPVDCAAVAWNRAGASTVGDKTGRRGMARTMTAGLCSRRLADRFFSRSTSRLLMHPQKRAITWLRRRPGFPLQLWPDRWAPRNDSNGSLLISHGVFRSCDRGKSGGGQRSRTAMWFKTRGAYGGKLWL